jgi:hypothetical protein
MRHCARRNNHVRARGKLNDQLKAEQNEVASKLWVVVATCMDVASTSVVVSTIRVL